MKTYDLTEDNYNEVLFRLYLTVSSDVKAIEETSEEIIVRLNAVRCDIYSYDDYGDAAELISIPNKWLERVDTLGAQSHRLVSLGFASAGSICAINREEYLTQEQIEVAQQICENHGFLYVPTHYIQKPFEGYLFERRYGSYRGQTWWHFLIGIGDFY